METEKQIGQIINKSSEVCEEDVLGRMSPCNMLKNWRRWRT